MLNQSVDWGFASLNCGIVRHRMTAAVSAESASLTGKLHHTPDSGSEKTTGNNSDNGMR